VSLRAPKDTIDSLRLTLQRFEQTSDAAHDPEARIELKRILLLRIATLEALEALKAGASSQEAAPPLPAAPAPPPELPQQLVTRASDTSEVIPAKDSNAA
jgi:hypothetical protein